MNFVDLKDGAIFSGIDPYIHWFPGQQSTGINYTMYLMIMSTYNELIISESENSTIKLINIPNASTEENINEFFYKNIEDFFVDGNLILNNGYKFGDKYLYVVYFYTKSDVGAEIIDTFKIQEGDKTYTIKVGADFYNEDETLKINASNLGINIPDSIQKSIYESNVHEESIDNILINRKLKELLSNYWDIIANRGSYKSLLNSLKWFEYGDLIRLREIWSHENRGVLKYDDRELSAIMNEKYKDTFENFYKTTSFAIYLALQQETNELDSEKNPVLEKNVFQWSLNDLALKMCLLGNFYETYFMPIHTELLHSSIEDKTFTNNIKISNSTLNSCHDIIALTQSFDCEVNNKKDIILTNVNVWSCKDTLFYNDSDDKMVGVDDSNSELDKSSLKYYRGIGRIVPIKCKFDISESEKISFGQIIWNGTTVQETGLARYESYNTDDKMYEITFNLLVTSPSNTLVMYFLSTTGKHYTKSIKIDAKDPSYIDLKLFKIHHKNDPITLDGDGYIGEPMNLSVPMFDGESKEVNYFLSYNKPIMDEVDSTNWVFKSTGIDIKYAITLDGTLKVNQTDYWFNLVDSYFINKKEYNVKIPLIPEPTLEITDSDGNELRKGSVLDLIPPKTTTNVLYDNINKGEFTLGKIYKITNEEIKNYNEVNVKFNLKYINTFLKGKQIFCISLVATSKSDEDLMYDINKENLMYDINKGQVDYMVTEEFVQSDEKYNIYLKYDHDKIKNKNIYIVIYLKNKLNDQLNFEWLKFSEINLSKLSLRFGNDGIALSNFVVIKNESIINDDIENNYFLYTPKNSKYKVLISKNFYDDIRNYINIDESILFQDWRYIDQFHTKDELNYDSLDECTIRFYDNLCITPRVIENESSYPLYYSNKCKSPTWKFINRSRLDSTSSFDGVQEPYVSSNINQALKPGFYDIEFSYNLNGEEKTIRKNSAFFKKD